MVLGLVQYRLGARRLGEAGLLRSADEPHVLQQRARNFYLTAAGIAAVVTILAFLATSGAILVTIQPIGDVAGVRHLDSQRAVFPVPVHCGRSVEDGEEAPRRDRLALSPLGCVLVRLRASRLLHEYLCAFDLTDRVVSGWEMPASWLQNVNPVLIVLFAPVFGWLWTWLARRNANPSIPVKFALGLFGLAAGFFVISWGAVNARGGEPGVHVLVSGHLFPSHGG